MAVDAGGGDLDSLGVSMASPLPCEPGRHKPVGAGRGAYKPLPFRPKPDQKGVSNANSRKLRRPQRGRRAAFGAPGSGKLDLLLRLLDHGFNLVADDASRSGTGAAACVPGRVAGGPRARNRPASVPRRQFSWRWPSSSARAPSAGTGYAALGVPLVTVDPALPSAPARIRLAMECAGGRVSQRPERSHERSPRRRGDRIVGGGQGVDPGALEDIGYNAVDNPPLNLLETLISRADQPIAVGLDTRSRGFDAELARVRDPPQSYPGGAGRAGLRLGGRVGLAAPLHRNAAPPPDGAPGQGDRRHPRRRPRPGRCATRRTCCSTHLNCRWPSFGADRGTLLARLAAWDVPASRCPHLLRVSRRSAARGGHGVRCRFLRNPHYDPILRPGTGLDPEVAAYVEARSGFRRFFQNLLALLTLSFRASCRKERSTRRSPWVHRRGAPLRPHRRALGAGVEAAEPGWMRSR